jgi:tripartite-type tricarboxylate transporter receptor subunit TctC
MRTILNTAFAHVIWIALTMTSAAAGYPTKPIRLIVASAPGGAPDIAGRLVASELSRQMGQLVVVDNRPGAAGIIGFQVLAKAAPDGYTLGYASFPFITNPIVYSTLPYDTAKDFQPVIWATSSTYLMTVTPVLPVQSVRELIEYARANPGKLSYGGVGTTAGNTLAVELLKFMTGTQIVFVPYKGIQQAIFDTSSGQVHIVCDTPNSILPHIRAGRVRLLGVTALNRLPVMPDIPTVAEAGLPGYEMMASSGYLVPAHTPRGIVVRLNTEINKALVSPAAAERYVASGIVIAGGTPEQFTEHLRKETEKWGKVIKAAGIKPQ